MIIFKDNPRWLAPEVIQRKPYSEKSDVYSFGVIMWEIVERRNPFDSVNIK
jgi:serine/threonine protein kinase